MKCKFEYYDQNRKVGEIIKEGRSLQDCILSFETDHPDWSWKVVTPLLDINNEY